MTDEPEKTPEEPGDWAAGVQTDPDETRPFLTQLLAFIGSTVAAGATMWVIRLLDRIQHTTSDHPPDSH